MLVTSALRDYKIPVNAFADENQIWRGARRPALSRVHNKIFLLQVPFKNELTKSSGSRRALGALVSADFAFTKIIYTHATADTNGEIDIYSAPRRQTLAAGSQGSHTLVRNQLTVRSQSASS